MHELFLPIMVMVFTVLVMAGLVLVFRPWMTEREHLLERSDAANGRSSAD